MRAFPSSGAPGTLDTAALYRDYVAAVTRWANRLARPPLDAEDLVQEVFLVVERRRGSLPPLHSPAAWLYRITHNIARNQWRARDRHATTAASPQWLAELIDETPGPLEDLERRRSLERVRRAFVALGRRDQRLIWLCDVRGVPSARVSALTGIKPQTLRVRRHRARLQITRRIELPAAP
jgi:RNA polymerase sigma factor (sigma-70 family)